MYCTYTCLKDCIHYSVNTLYLTVALLLSRPGKSNLLLDIRDTFCRCQVIWEKDEFFLQQKKLLLRNRVNIIKEKYISIFNSLQLHIYILYIERINFLVNQSFPCTKYCKSKQKTKLSWNFLATKSWSSVMSSVMKC